MYRADYIWGIKDSVLWIRDLDQGGKSVTNDLENVLIEIAHKLIDQNMILPPFIIYRDSEGMWDGVNISTLLGVVYYPLRSDSMKKAIQKVKEIYTGKSRGASL